MKHSKLSNEEISVIDDRIEYYFENNDHTDDAEELASFVIEGGEIDGSKYDEVKKYIESNL